jgi:hypothetical protein
MEVARFEIEVHWRRGEVKPSGLLTDRRGQVRAQHAAHRGGGGERADRHGGVVGGGKDAGGGQDAAEEGPLVCWCWLVLVEVAVCGQAAVLVMCVDKGGKGETASKPRRQLAPTSRPPVDVVFAGQLQRLGAQDALELAKRHGLSVGVVG